MSKHLFLFTIGPVQSFISQARKTQDLYAGSLLLSELINEVISKIEKLKLINATGLIFPLKTLDSKPNRIIAFIDTDDPQIAGETIEKALKAKFLDICKEVCRKKYKIDNSEKEFEQQVTSFLDVYWLALPYYGNYEDSFDKIEKYLGGIKNIRTFNQLPEKGRKCALCGERNVLFYKPFKSGDLKSNIGAHITVRKKDFTFNPGEGLCAICTMKRLYESDTFPSTARISLFEVLRQVCLKNEGSVYLDTYKNLFKIPESEDSHFDEQLYYEDNLTGHYFRKHDFEDLVEILPNIKEKHEKIKDYAKDEKIKFPKYYAVLTFDGDSMGKWLSGEKLKNKKDDLEKFHRQLSAYLGDFAAFARNLLEYPEDNEFITKQSKYLGRTAYAGGDDFLGFVNLNHLFQVLQSLKNEFNISVNQKIKKEFKLINPDENLTFSAGISIAHYKAPLSIALEWARIMQKKAKALEGKDAIGLALIKHSGDIAKSVLKSNWIYLDIVDKTNSAKTKNIDLAYELVKLLNNQLSNKFLYTLREEFLHLVEPETRIGFIAPEIQAELIRLIQRHQKNPAHQAANYHANESSLIDLDELADLLNNLILEMDKTIAKDVFHNFMYFLEICNFVSRER